VFQHFEAAFEYPAHVFSVLPTRRRAIRSLSGIVALAATWLEGRLVAASNLLSYFHYGNIFHYCMIRRYLYLPAHVIALRGTDAQPRSHLEEQ
jgi:hypothetical protein